MTSKFSFITAASALAVGAALVLSGCSSHASASTGSSSSSAKSSPTPGQGRAGGQGGFGGGGTSGEIAAISGSTLQVQSTSEQTAVTYSSSTTIRKTVDVALSDVQVGECVTASTLPSSGSSSSSSSSAVTTVSITQANNGSCDNGFGGQRGGASGSGSGSGSGQRPSGRPSGFPSRAPRSGSGGQGRGFVLPTSGKVTAVSGSTITVDALDFQTQKTSSKTVTVDSSTKYTEQQTGAASDLVVGQCVLAIGKADDSGTVAATALTLSAPVNGNCTSGFGGRGGFPGGGQGGRTQSGSSDD